jgi:hypothetical protein
VSQDKWDKVKAQIAEIILMIKTDPDHWDHKCLEQVQGFLQYVTPTYSGMTPYIIGFHLTIDGWHANILVSGWRNKEGEARDQCGDGGVCNEILQIEMALGQTRDDLGLNVSHSDPPKFVKAVPCLFLDLKALCALTSGKMPPLKRARCSKTTANIYNFMDASGCGFGSTFQVGNKVFFQYGQWPE